MPTQQFRHVLVTFPCRIVQKRSVFSVLGIDIGLVGQQQFHTRSFLYRADLRRGSLTELGRTHPLYQDSMIQAAANS
jgi:hypothetical protein